MSRLRVVPQGQMSDSPGTGEVTRGSSAYGRGPEQWEVDRVLMLLLALPALVLPLVLILARIERRLDHPDRRP